MLLVQMGKLEEARPLYEEALQAFRETLGDRHPNTLGSISNMGVLLKKMGKLEKAKPLYEEALQGERETLGDRHPETLTSIGNMGALLYAMGMLEEARPLCSRKRCRQEKRRWATATRTPWTRLNGWTR